jgi:hypothetical protein
MYVATATALGLVMKKVVKTRGMVVSFLGRWYGEAWEGSPNSCVDIPRQLRKLHVSVDHQVEPEEKMVQKAMSFAVTDPQTYIIGPWARKVLEICGTVAQDHKLMTFWSKWSLDVQFPNKYADWMASETQNELDFNYSTFRKHLAKCTEPHHLLEFPLCAEPAYPQDSGVHVNGELTGSYEPTPSKPTSSPDGAAKPKPKRKRNRKRKGKGKQQNKGKGKNVANKQQPQRNTPNKPASNKSNVGKTTAGKTADKGKTVAQGQQPQRNKTEHAATNKPNVGNNNAAMAIEKLIGPKRQ